MQQQDNNKTNQMSANDMAIEKLNEWLNSSVAHLSQRVDYAKGYKAGIIRGREIIAEIFITCGVPCDYFTNH